MAYEWDFKAIDLQFRYYQITKFPITWNPKTRKFSFKANPLVDFIPWFFNFYILRLTVAHAFVMYLFFLDETPLFLKILMAFIMLVSFGFLGFGTLIVYFGNDTVTTHTGVHDVHKIVLQTLGKKRDAKHVNNAKMEGSNVKLEYLEGYLKERIQFILVFLSILAPPVIVIGVEILDIFKPIRMVIVETIANALGLSIGLGLTGFVRLSITAIVAVELVENARIFPYLLHYFLFPNKLWLDMISCTTKHFNDNVSSAVELVKLHSSYMKMSVLLHYVQTFAAPESFFLIKGFSNVCPALLFFCIRMYEFFPILVYAITILATPAAFAICLLIIINSASIYEKTNHNITMWNIKVNQSGKELVRMYKHLKPLGYKMGLNSFNFNSVNYDALKDLMMDMQNTTIDLLILFPAKYFRSK